jgi:glycosyltransferase involved in cell wall biosynthesis
LKEEFAQSGIKFNDFVSWGIIRELAEYELADAIAVPSQFVKRTFIQYGVPESKVFVCPYGVDLSLYRKEPKLDDRFRILFVGSASIHKGIRYLFEAVRPLVQRNLVELWLVGDIRNEVKDVCRKNRDLFTFKGFIPRAHLSSMYSQGSVLVLPSVDEGLALVMAQAMACGVPVIATHNTGAEDLIEDGSEGFIVPPRDASAIRDRIEWMIDHPTARLEMGERAQMRVSTLNGWQGYGERVESMYSALLRATDRKRWLFGANVPLASQSASGAIQFHGTGAEKGDS